MMQDIIAITDTAKIEENKKALDAMYTALGFDNDKMTKLDTLFSGGSNELPTDKEFSFVSFEAVIVEENKRMNHVVMVTDTGHRISLSALTRIGLIGDDALEPKFQANKALKGGALLQGGKNINPKLQDLFNSKKITRKMQPEFLVNNALRFKAEQVTILTYFPQEGEEIKGTAITELNNSSANNRLAQCKPQELYVLTRVS